MTGPLSGPGEGLGVLAVDDEPPALSELAFLLGRDPRVGRVRTAGDGATALRILQEEHVDAVFLDIRMPGLTGLDLARVLARFRNPPPVVFVTAYDDHAVDAFDLHAVDYVMKPVRAERLAEAVRRVVDAMGSAAAEEEPADAPDETIPVELGGVTRFVNRSDVRFVEAQGDYARLHTSEGSHLVRVPLATLEERWGPAGFVRIHRSHLISLAHIEELRIDGGRCSVRVGGEMLAVSRRHTRELRDLLVRRARPGRQGG
ncbi:MAG TPA: LytTR family DNA-binding domain-containing protein [Jiangellales bacterium]|nr:LytTR family DNA-binding domain-containing protein [Jiangellales bacterium]